MAEASGISERICDLLAESFKKKPLLEMMAVQEETRNACKRFGVKLPDFLAYLRGKAGVSDDAFYTETLLYFNGKACRCEICALSRCAVFPLLHEIRTAVGNSYANGSVDPGNPLLGPCMNYGMAVENFTNCLLKIRTANFQKPVV